MDNPFHYGEIVRGPFFAGRAREKAELAGDMRSGQNVVIISPRRYGKTSLVLETLDTLDRRQVVWAYVDLLRAATIDRLPEVLASALYTGIVSPLERTWHRASELFHDLPLRPKLSISTDGSVNVEFGAVVDRQDATRTLDQLLELPGRIVRERELRVVLVLDEFQSVVDLDPDLPTRLRAIFQHQAEVCHVFLGSRRHMMARLFTDANEPLFRAAKPILLGPLPSDEFALFILERFASTRTPIADETVKRVLDLTQGHPSDTQELCYFLWSEAFAAGRFPVPGDLVEVALERVLDAESARFLTIWERLPPHQRATLAGIAAEPGVGVYTAAFRRQHRLGDPARVQRSVDRLLQLGIVETLPLAEPSYRATDTFLALWLRRIGAVG